MIVGRILCAVLFTCFGAAWTYAQDTPPPASAPASNPVLTKRPVSAPATAMPDASAAITETIPLIIPKVRPLQVVRNDEVRVKSAAQPIKAHSMEPRYAFDKLVIPVGTIVTGQIKK